VTDSRALFRSGRRYRGFVSTDRGAVPVTFNVYPLTPEEVRLKHIFPTNITERLDRGSVVFVLIENEKPLIGELRILSPGGRFIPARLDYVTEDRRKLPRVKVEDVLEVKAELACRTGHYTGRVIDLSMTSISVNTGVDLAPQNCSIQLSYRDTRVQFRGRVIRSFNGTVVVELGNDNPEMTDILGKIYTDIFLINQRSG